MENDILAQEFSRFIEEKKINGIGKFDWKISENAKQKILSLGIRFPSEHANDAERLNAEIRCNFAEVWHNTQQQDAIARWIIGDWGGIGGNKAKKIGEIIKICNSRCSYPFDGISSYSKVLSFIEPEEFFVYDSRVALSLNWIQIQLDRHTIYFHIPPSQAKNTLMASLVCESSYETGFMQKIPKDKIYPTYIELIKAIGRRSNRAPLEIEMFLFSYAKMAEDEIITAHRLTPFNRRKQKIS